MLCLDLSQSMNKRSAISDSRPTAHEEKFKPETEAKKVTVELLDGYSDSIILEQGTHKNAFKVFR